MGGGAQLSLHLLLNPRPHPTAGNPPPATGGTTCGPRVPQMPMLCGSGNLGMLGSPGLPSLRTWALEGLQCLALPLGCLTPYNPLPNTHWGAGAPESSPHPMHHLPTHSQPACGTDSTPTPTPTPRGKLGATTLSSGPMRALPSSTAQPQATRSSSLSLGVWSSAPPPPLALVRT